MNLKKKTSRLAKWKRIVIQWFNKVQYYHMIKLIKKLLVMSSKHPQIIWRKWKIDLKIMQPIWIKILFRKMKYKLNSPSLNKMFSQKRSMLKNLKERNSKPNRLKQNRQKKLKKRNQLNKKIIRMIICINSILHSQL